MLPEVLLDIDLEGATEIAVGVSMICEAEVAGISGLERSAKEQVIAIVTN
jgi:hypothetical protein